MRGYRRMRFPRPPVIFKGDKNGEYVFSLEAQEKLEAFYVTEENDKMGEIENMLSIVLEKIFPEVETRDPEVEAVDPRKALFMWKDKENLKELFQIFEHLFDKDYFQAGNEAIKTVDSLAQSGLRPANMTFCICIVGILIQTRHYSLRALDCRRLKIEEKVLDLETPYKIAAAVYRIALQAHSPYAAYRIADMSCHTPCPGVEGSYSLKPKKLLEGIETLRSQFYYYVLTLQTNTYDKQDLAIPILNYLGVDGNYSLTRKDFQDADIEALFSQKPPNLRTFFKYLFYPNYCFSYTNYRRSVPLFRLAMEGKIAVAFRKYGGLIREKHFPYPEPCDYEFVLKAFPAIRPRRPFRYWRCVNLRTLRFFEVAAFLGDSKAFSDYVQKTKSGNYSARYPSERDLQYYGLDTNEYYLGANCRERKDPQHLISAILSIMLLKLAISQGNTSVFKDFVPHLKELNFLEWKCKYPDIYRVRRMIIELLGVKAGAIKTKFLFSRSNRSLVVMLGKEIASVLRVEFISSPELLYSVAFKIASSAELLAALCPDKEDFLRVINALSSEYFEIKKDIVLKRAVAISKSLSNLFRWKEEGKKWLYENATLRVQADILRLGMFGQEKNLQNSEKKYKEFIDSFTDDPSPTDVLELVRAYDGLKLIYSLLEKEELKIDACFSILKLLIGETQLEELKETLKKAKSEEESLDNFLEIADEYGLRERFEDLPEELKEELSAAVNVAINLLISGADCLEPEKQENSSNQHSTVVASEILEISESDSDDEKTLSRLLIWSCSSNRSPTEEDPTPTNVSGPYHQLAGN